LTKKIEKMEEKLAEAEGKIQELKEKVQKMEMNNTITISVPLTMSVGYK